MHINYNTKKTAFWQPKVPELQQQKKEKLGKNDFPFWNLKNFKEIKQADLGNNQQVKLIHQTTNYRFMVASPDTLKGKHYVWNLVKNSFLRTVPSNLRNKYDFHTNQNSIMQINRGVEYLNT